MREVELMLFVYESEKAIDSAMPVATISANAFFVPNVNDIIELGGVGYKIYERTFCLNGPEHEQEWTCVFAVIPVH